MLWGCRKINYPSESRDLNERHIYSIKPRITYFSAGPLHDPGFFVFAEVRFDFLFERVYQNILFYRRDAEGPIKFIDLVSVARASRNYFND